MEEKNKEIIFSEELAYLVDSFGEKNQDGVKYALRTCQETFDCVSKAHQEEIAESFEVDIKVIKTFMRLTPSLKESIVEYEVVCCTGARCAKNGSMEVLKTVSEELGLEFGKTSSDGKIRLTTQNCFKKCGEGPNMMINGKFFHKLDGRKAKEIIENIK